MRMTKLAVLNFKSSAKSFLSLILSLAFTIMIFLNFENITYSDAFLMLGERNKEYVDIIIQVLCFILGVFSFFYIWYATNVFLTNRKKEIGIYVFMGLSNEKIGKMYMIESAIIGVTALVIGLFFGILTTGLFQMVILALSDLAVEIQFRITPEPVIITGIVYAVIYGIFILKGYFNIVKSSVLGMISAAKQNEYVRQNPIVLLLKAVAGSAVLGAGFYLAVKDAGMELMGNALAAVILVTAGVYLMFGGLIPFVFYRLSHNKKFLYRKQRSLWVNQVIFRMKKNYRTYAMVCVLALSSVTALATGVAMKNRYDNIVQFENTYTFQFLTNQKELETKAESVLNENGGIRYKTKLPVLMLEAKEGDSGWGNAGYLFVSYTKLKALAKDAGLEFSLSEPKDNEVIYMTNLPLMSFITHEGTQTKVIAGNSYVQIEETRLPYLGYLQNMMCIYVVNDMEYERLLPYGQALYTYNYRISENSKFGQAKTALDVFTENTNGVYTARVAVDPSNSDIDWIKVAYSLCIFVFLAFITASGCIMFMKIYNDASEEKERYAVLKKLGISGRTLQKSINCELLSAYGLAFSVMAVSSFFSVCALAKVMFTNLISVWIVSVFTVFVIFALFYRMSAVMYRKTVRIQG